MKYRRLYFVENSTNVHENILKKSFYYKIIILSANSCSGSVRRFHLGSAEGKEGRNGQFTQFSSYISNLAIFATIYS